MSDRNGRTSVVTLDGELDIASLDEAAKLIEEAEASSPSVLVIDLSGLTFVDSSGVRLVLLAERRARDGGRSLRVHLGHGSALRVFQALGLVAKLDIEPGPPGSASPDGTEP